MANHYFHPTANQGTGDGSSEANAQQYSTANLDTAEGAASSGDTIFFLDGDYTSLPSAFDNGSTAQVLTYRSLNPLGARLLKTSYGKLGLGYGTDDLTSTSTTIVRDFYTQNIQWEGNTDGAIIELRGIKQVDTANATHGLLQGYIAGKNKTSLAHVVQGCSFTLKANNDTGFIGNMINGTVSESSFHILFDGTAGTKKIGQYTDFDSYNSFQHPTFKNTIISCDTDETLHTGLRDTSKLSYSCINTVSYFGGVTAAETGTNFNADPQFVDAPNGDLRLRPTSPCIGAGTAS